MARYTNLLTVPKSIPCLRDSIADSLKSCGLSLIYEAGDYLVAKEKPGHVSLAQLATIEVLINPPTSNLEEAKVNLVVRNEELPLHRDNHCQRVFETVNQAISAAV
jgi:hypothetical protein